MPHSIALKPSGVSRYIENNRHAPQFDRVRENTPAMETVSGFTLSVQAGGGRVDTISHHYCYGADGHRSGLGPWTEVECGFPNTNDVAEILPWQQMESVCPTEAVYPYVPVEVVATTINRRGGLKNWIK